MDIWRGCRSTRSLWSGTPPPVEDALHSASELLELELYRWLTGSPMTPERFSELGVAVSGRAAEVPDVLDRLSVLRREEADPRISKERWERALQGRHRNLLFEVLE